MITTLIDSYIDAKFTSLNRLFSDSIKINRIQSNLDIDKVSMGESNIAYQTDMTIERGKFETNKIYYSNVEIRFKFLVVNKDSTRYNYIMDNYLFMMERLLKSQRSPYLTYYDTEVMDNELTHSDAEISQALIILGISDIQTTNTSNFKESFFMPSITFRLKVYDKGTVNADSTISLAV